MYGCEFQSISAVRDVTDMGNFVITRILAERRVRRQPKFDMFGGETSRKCYRSGTDVRQNVHRAAQYALSYLDRSIFSMTYRKFKAKLCNEHEYSLALR